MNLYQRLLALTDEAVTTLRTIQETQAVALRAHVAAQRASEASESAAIFRDAATESKNANERSAVVSWLRERADIEPRNPASSALDVAADCIERGEHLMFLDEAAGSGVAKS